MRNGIWIHRKEGNLCGTMGELRAPEAFHRETCAREAARREACAREAVRREACAREAFHREICAREAACRVAIVRPPGHKTVYGRMASPCTPALGSGGKENVFCCSSNNYSCSRKR